jgi:hypothetical protein
MCFSDSLYFEVAVSDVIKIILSNCIRHYVITVVVTLDCYDPVRNDILTAVTSMCIAHCADMTRAEWHIL